MDIVLGFVGIANAGKDTTNSLIKQGLFEKEEETCVDAETQVRYQVGYVHDCYEHKKRTMCFHVPLALEVKREYVEEQKQLGVNVSLEALLYDPVEKNKHRDGLIRIGDGKREHVDPLYWLKKVETMIALLRSKYADKADNLIFSVTDMRYENELPYMEQYCQQNGLKILSIKVVASLATVLKRMEAKRAVEYAQKAMNNASERNVKRVHADIELHNESGMYDLICAVKEKVIPVIGFLVGS